MSVSQVEQTKALEREWWRRLPRIIWRPREVFAALDGSNETAEALQEPIVAVTLLAGIGMFLSTSTAGTVFDDPEFDTVLLVVEAFLAGALVALQNYWLGGAALLLGLRSLGSMARYREARHVAGLSTAPFVLALVLLWPVRLVVFGGDLFRAGGSDEGTAGYVLTGIDAFFLAWTLALVLVGVRTVQGWGWMRSLGATAFAGMLFLLLVVAAVYA